MPKKTKCNNPYHLNNKSKHTCNGCGEQFSKEDHLCSTCKTNTLDKCEKVEHKHKIQIIDGERQMNDNGNWICECGATTFPGCGWSEPVKPEGVGEWEERFKRNYFDSDGDVCPEDCDLDEMLNFISNLLLQEKAKWKQEVIDQAITVEVWDREEKDYVQDDIVRLKDLALIDKL